MALKYFRLSKKQAKRRHAATTKRSSATAQKQRVSYTHVFLGWPTDPAIHSIPQML